LSAIVKRIIGLTGGIATGKTTVANYLQQEYGFPIFDADIYSRSSVLPETPIYRAIVDRYSNSILLPDGQIDRLQLGKIVFSTPEERQWLETQIHPFVRRSLCAAIDSLSEGSIAVAAIPLLFEAKMTDLVTEIWVVTCLPETQLQRVMMRDRLSATEATTRISSQLPLCAKILLADATIDNSHDFDETKKQVDLLLN
jgi:dephospho-CoA kinase